MWVIVMLLLVSFPMILASRIAKTRRISRILFCSGIAVWAIVAYVRAGAKDDWSFPTIMGFLIAASVVSDLIARSILRRRLTPPCVRVRITSREAIVTTVVSFLGVAFLIVLLFTGGTHSLGLDLFLSFITAAILIELVFAFEKPQICGNGLWQYGSLQPWSDYEYFSWKKNAEDGVELKLVMKSEIWPSRRLMVLPEDREAVHHLLSASLPDLSTTGMSSRVPAGDV